MTLPDKLYFMPQDTEDEAGIEIGDGRVLQLHPYDDIDAELLETVVHRYNNFLRALEALKEEHNALIAENNIEHLYGNCATCDLIAELEEVAC